MLPFLRTANRPQLRAATAHVLARFNSTAGSSNDNLLHFGTQLRSSTVIFMVMCFGIDERL